MIPRTGVYSIEPRRRGMGVIPIPSGASFTPTTPSGGQASPGTGGTWAGVVPGIGVGLVPVDVVGRIADAANLAAVQAELAHDPIADTSSLRLLRDALRRAPSSGGLVDARLVKQMLDFVISNPNRMHRLDDAFVIWWRGTTTATLEHDLVSGVYGGGTTTITPTRPTGAPSASSGMTSTSPPPAVAAAASVGSTSIASSTTQRSTPIETPPNIPVANTPAAPAVTPTATPAPVGVCPPVSSFLTWNATRITGGIDLAAAAMWPLNTRICRVGDPVGNTQRAVVMHAYADGIGGAPIAALTITSSSPLQWEQVPFWLGPVVAAVAGAAVGAVIVRVATR